MAIEISAIFESPDMADFALRHLRDNQVNLQSYTIQPLRYHPLKRVESEPPILYPAGMFNGLGIGGGGGIGMTSYTAGPVVHIPHGTHDAEIASKEVVLDAFVSESDVTKARSILISAHGRKVRQLS